MAERLFISNYGTTNIMGGSEKTNGRISKVLNLKHFYASKLGIDVANLNMWEVAGLIDETVNMIEDIDVLVHNSTNCYSLKEKATKKNICICHEHFKKEAKALVDADPRLNIMKKTIDWQFQKLVMSKSDINIVQSKGEQKSFEEDGFKTTVLEPCINQDIFRPTNSERSGILFIGRMAPRKGWNIMEQLFKEFPEKTFHCVIGGNEVGQISKDNVCMYGGLTDTEIVAMYNTCDFLINPSLYESFGMTNIEAMMCNTPIISTYTGVFEDWHPMNRGIFVREPTVDNFAKAIKQFYNDPIVSETDEGIKYRFSEKRFEKELKEITNE